MVRCLCGAWYLFTLNPGSPAASSARNRGVCQAHIQKPGRKPEWAIPGHCFSLGAWPLPLPAPASPHLPPLCSLLLPPPGSAVRPTHFLASHWLPCPRAGSVFWHSGHNLGLALAKGSKVGPPPLVSWDALLHFLHHRWLHRFGRYTHSCIQALSSLSCSSETLLHQPTRRPQALIFHSLPVFLPQPVFSAWGPGSLPRSPLLTAVLLSPQPPHPFPSHPTRSRPCTPWSHPVSPGCWGCRRNAPHLPAESEPQGRLPLKFTPQASPQKLPHSFKTLFDPCCPPPPPPRCLRENKGAPVGDTSASCHAPQTLHTSASLVSPLLSWGTGDPPCDVLPSIWAPNPLSSTLSVSC